MFAATEIEMSDTYTDGSVDIGTSKAKVWKAADDRVLLERIESKEKTTEGGLVLPEKVGQGVQRGIVLAAGPNAAGVKPDDLVYYMQKSAIPVEIGIFSVYASDVIAIQREE